MLMLLMALATTSDADLVRRFKEGDKTAYAEIVKRYQDRVYTLSLRWMKDPQLAEDVAQDVFVALFRSLDRFRGEAQLSTWIYRVVVNHCKNRKLYRMRRKSDRHEPLEGTGDPDGPPREFAAVQPGTDAGVHQTDAQRLLQEGLASLDEEQRHIIVLRDIQDLSYEEISAILDLPRGTVKSRLHRARSRLAALLSPSITKEDLI